MAKSKGLATILIALSSASHAAEPVTCATCHRAEAQSQPHTPMGIGIEEPPNQVLLKEHPTLSFEKNGYTYRIERKGDVSTYTVSDGTNSLTLPIRYAFGIRMQTFVLEHEGGFYQSLVSYYPRIGGLDITMGEERLEPRNLVEAMGRENSAAETASCFGCHSTGGVTNGQLQLELHKPGLQCEHCHAGTDAHQQGIAQGNAGPIPKRLGQMSAEDTSNFCGNCHRSWDTVVRMRLWGQINVRFQPYRLANSKCFLGDDRRIACTACHNPHQNLVRTESSYDAKCLACHAPGTQARIKPVSVEDSKPAGAMQKPCPVAHDNCVSCHMPKVELPGGHALFTDHYIRVVRPGETYPN